jgi:hypothetical protein
MRILWAFNVCMAPRAELPLHPADYPGFMPRNPGICFLVCLVVKEWAEKKGLLMILGWRRRKIGVAEMEEAKVNHFVERNHPILEDLNPAAEH